MVTSCLLGGCREKSPQGPWSLRGKRWVQSAVKPTLCRRHHLPGRNQSGGSTGCGANTAEASQAHPAPGLAAWGWGGPSTRAGCWCQMRAARRRGHGPATEKTPRPTQPALAARALPWGEGPGEEPQGVVNWASCQWERELRVSQRDGHWDPDLAASFLGDCKDNVYIPPQSWGIKPEEDAKVAGRKERPAP